MHFKGLPSIRNICEPRLIHLSQPVLLHSTVGGDTRAPALGVHAKCEARRNSSPYKLSWLRPIGCFSHDMVAFNLQPKSS